MRGQFNSSITRVRPFFQQLIHRNTNDWTANILSILPSVYAKLMANNTGSILPELLTRRMYNDKILKRYDLETIELEKCFEFSLEPPDDFLRWLIENPEKLTWPLGKTYGEVTTRKRRALIAGDLAVQQEALDELQKYGAAGSLKKWWAFEGFTEVDCLIETDTMLLAVEGKRTEKGPSNSTDWFPTRNQLVRNIEALKQKAKGKPYGVLLINENAESDLSDEEFAESLPHYPKKTDRDEMKSHYLGSVTWQQACKETGIDYAELPQNTANVAEKIKSSPKTRSANG